MFAAGVKHYLAILCFPHCFSGFEKLIHQIIRPCTILNAMTLRRDNCIAEDEWLSYPSSRNANFIVSIDPITEGKW
jgi:hypothetical protein